MGGVEWRQRRQAVDSKAKVGSMESVKLARHSDQPRYLFPAVLARDEILIAMERRQWSYRYMAMVAGSLKNILKQSSCGSQTQAVKVLLTKVRVEI